MNDRKPSRRANNVWRRLVQTYGTKMADQYGPSPPPDWCTLIDRTDDDRIESAIVAVRQKYVDWPPTLPQFEASIPGRKITHGDSIPDRLAVYAVRALKLCEHQLPIPWTYFGKVTEEWYEPWKQTRKNYETRGVTIPACAAEGCPKYGVGHRVLVSDLPMEDF